MRNPPSSLVSFLAFSVKFLYILTTLIMSFLPFFVRFIPKPSDSLFNGNFLNVLNTSAAKIIFSSGTFFPKSCILLNIMPSGLNIKSRS